jgi:hypothetical protein
MGNLRQYFFSILICALSSGIFQQIVSDSKKRALIQMACSTVLVILILNPLSTVDFGALLQVHDAGQNTAADYIAEGKKMIMEAKKEEMMSSCEAYISERAKILGSSITATVTLNDHFLPVFVKIEGQMEPILKTELEKMLTMDMGIPRENQEWIWNQENNDS